MLRFGKICLCIFAVNIEQEYGHVFIGVEGNDPITTTLSFASTCKTDLSGTTGTCHDVASIGIRRKKGHDLSAFFLADVLIPG